MPQREVPEYISNLIISLGGRNPFGKPMFRVVWGGDAVNVIYGQMEGGSRGRHEVLRYHGIPAWHIEIWKPSEMFGTREEWYEKSYDAISGLHVCGDYPTEGDYCPCIKLYHFPYVNGEKTLEILPLSEEVIRTFIPLIEEAKGISLEERKRINAEKEEKALRERLNQGEAAYLSAAMAFGGAAGTHESNHEAWEARIKAKQAGMKVSAEQIKRQMGNGHRQLILNRDREKVN